MSDDRKDKSEPLLSHATNGDSSTTSYTSDSLSLSPDATAQGLLHTITVLLLNRPLLLVVLFGCLGGLLFGYDIGVMGGVIVLDGFRRHFGFPLLVQGVEDDASTSASLAWLVSVFPLCCAATAIVSGSLSDFLGRRYSVLLGAVFFTVGGGLQALADSQSTLLLGRVLGGFAVGILSTIVPMFNAELSAPEVRGIMNTLFQLAITLGILFAFTFNLFTRYALGDGGWRWSLAMQSGLSAVLVLGIGFLPESPRWFMKKRREQDARAVLKRLRIVHTVDAAAAEEESKDGQATGAGGEGGAGFFNAQPVKDSLDAEVEEIRASIWEEEAAGVSSWSELLAPPMRLRLLYGCGMQAMQQATFINAVMYYSSIFFSAVGINPLVATAVTGLANVAFTFWSISYIDRVGRVPLLLWGGCGMLLSALLVACVSSLSAPVKANAGVSLSGLLIVVLVCTFVSSFAFSWGPMGWVIPAELFPLGARGKAVSLTTTVNWVGNFAIAEAVPSMLTAMGVGGTFYCIGASLAVALLFTLLIARETKAVSLERMEALFSKVQTKEQWLAYMRDNWRTGLVHLKVRDAAT